MPACAADEIVIYCTYICRCPDDGAAFMASVWHARCKMSPSQRVYTVNFRESAALPAVEFPEVSMLFRQEVVL